MTKAFMCTTTLQKSDHFTAVDGYEGNVKKKQIAGADLDSTTLQRATSLWQVYDKLFCANQTKILLVTVMYNGKCWKLKFESNHKWYTNHKPYFSVFQPQTANLPFHVKFSGPCLLTGNYHSLAGSCICVFTKHNVSAPDFLGQAKYAK